MADECTTAASEEGEQMDTTEDNNNRPGLDAGGRKQEDLASWINRNKGSSAPLTLCEEEQRLRRTLMRIDRSGSTESVVTTSGVESCTSSSEPGSPSRPVTPPMPPLPTHHHPPYDECLRDSEDSGLGPSPAKSVLGGRPNSPVSPIQFGSRCSDDSLLDLSPRTDNSYESEDNPKTDDAFYDEDDEEEDDENDAPIPKSPGSFKFLLSSSSNSQRTDEDFRRPQFQSSLLEDPFRCGTTTTIPQQTKFPSPLLTTATTFRCGPTTKPPTNVDHTFRHCNPPTSKQDTTASFFDEQARQQQDSHGPSNLLDHHFLKNHLNQQQPSSDEVSSNKLSDHHFLKNHLNQQQQNSGKVPSDNLTDKLNDHFLTNHLNKQQQSTSDEVSSINLTDKLSGHHYLKNHLNQPSNGEESSTNLTDHFLKNHLNQQQPTNSEVSSNNLTDKLNDHFLKNHLNQQQPGNGEVSSNLTDTLNDNFLKNHLNQPTSGEGSSDTLTDKLIDHHFLQNHHLNPKVVLIRSNFSGHGGYAEESNSSRQFELTTGSSDCTSSNCSQAGVDAQGGSSGSSTTTDDGACKWLDCDRSADANTTATDLVDHIRQCHVREQSDDDGKSFVCLWVGCKVYDRPSCSRSWLERHVLLHGGSKPFRCIVDGCHQRFGSEVVLERHVNSHFPQRTKLNSSHCKRKSRHKHKKRPTSNKSKDFFDDASMEHVRHNLLLLSSIDGINTGGPPSAITFRSDVIGRRTDSSGKVHLLLHWNPQNMLPDSWVPETEMLSNLEQTIPVSSLPPQALQLSSMAALAKMGVTPRPGKRKRK